MVDNLSGRGVASIKSEYLNVNICDNAKHEPKANCRGQNKRSKKYKRAKHLQMAHTLCPSAAYTVPDAMRDYVLKEKTCKLGPEKCYYQHDVQVYWKTREENRTAEQVIPCPYFSQRGWCPYGLACISAEDHTDPDSLHSLFDVERAKSWAESVSKNPSQLNILSKDVLFGLAKRKYDFSECKQFLSQYKANLETTQNEQDMEICEKDRTSPIDVYGDAETRRLDVKDKLVLAPLTTVGNLPFRRICVGMGADVTCAEMCMATSLLAGNPSEWALVKRHASEKMFGVQLCGGHYDTLYMASHVLVNHTKVDFIDLNLGCPIDLVCLKGGGCSMMKKVGRLHAVVDTLHTLLQPKNIPLTIKMRTGLEADHNMAHKIVKKYANSGKVSLFTLHGRSKEHRYTKLANWDYINECAKLANPVPLLGCGDVLNYEEYYQHLEQDASSISGIMIARGALVKPWIFTEIKERRHMDISSGERLDILKDYVKFGLEHWGSDSKGVESTRRFLLEWLSFLHRYIPVGLLEYLPQKMNLKPPPYFGRDELETLMCSENSDDWVKITEILLGRTPDTFEFIPKHKANSYSNLVASTVQEYNS